MKGRLIFKKERPKAVRAACLLLTLLLPLAAGGCSPSYESLAQARSANARLAPGLVIDGVALGGARVDEALEKLHAAHEALAAQTVFEIAGPGESLRLRAADFPIAWDTEAVLLQAFNAPRLGGEKIFSCTARIGGEGCRAALEEACAHLNTKAQDASFAYEDGAFRYSEERAGSRLDTALLSDCIVSLPLGDTHRLQAVMRTQSPGYTIEEARADTTLLSEFSTSFAGGNYAAKNRVHNIQKAAAGIDGVKLDPGEEFDMNALLGPRSAETGYKEANAIRDGAYVQEYGGGVCQVSSTLYNAVLMAGLEVSERSHHSWPLGYIDIGRDATISTGGPNFRFINSAQSPVYISALVDTQTQEVTVRIYGRAREDGLSIRLRSKKVESLPDPGDEVREDASLKPGEEKRVRESRPGSVSETYRLYYDSDGNLVREELVSRDKYRPVKGILLVGASPGAQ